MVEEMRWVAWGAGAWGTSDRSGAANAGAAADDARRTPAASAAGTGWLRGLLVLGVWSWAALLVVVEAEVARVPALSVGGAIVWCGAVVAGPKECARESVGLREREL